MLITETHPIATLAQKQYGSDPQLLAECWNELPAEAFATAELGTNRRPCRTVRQYQDRLRSQGCSETAIRLLTSHRCKRIRLETLTHDELAHLRAKALGLQADGWPSTMMVNHLGVDRRQLAHLLS
jgi:hypothetical protein